MTAALGRHDVERFRVALASRLGLYFEDGKLAFLADVLRRRIESTGHASEAYFRYLEEDLAEEEHGMLARELTVSETYFFRNVDQFRAVTEVALPARIVARASRKRLRILSAGCSSGEEPYSLGMIIRDSPIDSSWDVKITGVDVNPAVLQKAARARYSTWALRETPAEIQGRWFRSEGRDLVLQDAARRFVQFKRRNLLDDDPDLWQLGIYDIVFCRNVIMYLTPEAAQRVVDRISRSLAPAGFLFLGHAETLRGLSQSFHLRHTHETFYYQRKERDEAVASAHLTASSVPPRDVPPLAMVIDGGESWVDAIRRASERIEILTQAPNRTRPRQTGAGAIEPEPRWDLGQALDLLEKERFAEALDLVRAFPAESALDPDVLLLRAALLTHGGQFANAAETCRSLLQIDELNAGAHYLLALCREGTGDSQGAVEHDQVAVYLDPSFAMPRLHLGLLARRSGDRDKAEQEMRQALLLLQREDGSRLLLFGGGFSRAALIALCRAGLVTAGGKP